MMQVGGVGHGRGWLNGYLLSFPQNKMNPKLQAIRPKSAPDLLKSLSPCFRDHPPYPGMRSCWVQSLLNKAISLVEFGLLLFCCCCCCFVVVVVSVITLGGNDLFYLMLLGLYPSLREVGMKSSQQLEVEFIGKGSLLILYFSMFSWFSNIAQAHLPRDGAVLSGCCPAVPIICHQFHSHWHRPI